MRFDLGLYRSENSDQFGNASLEDVAKHIYNNVVPSGSGDGTTYASSGKFSDYNDFLKKTGLGDQLAADQQRREAPDRPGVLGSTVDYVNQFLSATAAIPATFLRGASGLVRGAADWTAAAGNALRDSPNLRTAASFVLGAPGAFDDSGIIRAMTSANSSTSLATHIANNWSESADQIDRDRNAAFPASQQMLRDEGYRGTVIGGLSSAYQSIVPAYLGGGLASAAGKASAVGKAAGLMSGSAAFGFGQYETSKALALQNGLNEDDARNYATKMGAWETGTELVSDALTLATGGEVPITSIGRKAMQNGLGGMLRTSLAQRGVDALKILGIEGGTELLNTYAQAETSLAAGLGEVNPETGKPMTGFDAVRSNFGEIGVASMAFALLGAHMNHGTRVQLRDMLTDPSIPPENKMPVVQHIGEEMNKWDSNFGFREGSAGTEFVASIERQLAETGNINLTNNLEYDAQLQHEIAGGEDSELLATAGDYSAQDDASRIAAEGAHAGDAPLGMKTDAELPSDVSGVLNGHASEMSDTDRAYAAQPKEVLPSESLDNPSGSTHAREDFDTHPGADELARRYARSRDNDISFESVSSALKTTNREDVAWAAAASKQRESDLWSDYRNAETGADRARIKTAIDRARYQHEAAMGRLERASGFDADAVSSKPMRPVPSDKMHPSVGDDSVKVRSGVVNAFTRFLNSHNLVMRKDSSGNVFLRKNTNKVPNRVENSRVANRAYDAGYIYDTHSINPKANYASGVVGGIPGFDKLHWRNIDSIAYHSPSINFNNTRVGAHALYNSALTEGSAEAVAQAENNLAKHYANRRAANRESRPADLFGDKTWSGPRISAAAASEIESRAQTAVERGSFKGRIREFTDSDGNRILRIVYNNESPDHFEDHLVDDTIQMTPESAKRMADKVSTGAQARSLMPRKVGTPANANDVVDGMLDKLAASDTDKARQQIAMITANRDAVVERIRRGMAKEYVHDKGSGDGLTADMSGASAVSESKFDDPYAVTENLKDHESDDSKSAMKVAAAERRGAARTDRTDAGEAARALFGSSGVSDHDKNLDNILKGIAEARKEASYQRRLSGTNIPRADEIDARLAASRAEERVKYGTAFYREYVRMMDEQATHEEGSGGYKEEIDSTAYRLADDGTRAQPRAGYVTYDEVAELISPRGDNGPLAKPVYTNGKLTGAIVTDRNGVEHRLLIDRTVDRFAMSAESIADDQRGPVGNYDRAHADDLAARLVSALNVAPAHFKNIHFVTAQELHDNHGLDNGLNGDIGAYNPITGQSYIITDNIASVDEFGRAVLHEVGAHDGLFALIPDQARRRELLDQLLTNRMVIDNFMADGHGDSKLLKHYGDLSPEVAERVGHEAFAALFSKMRMDPDGKFRLPNGRYVGSIIHRVLGTVRGAINGVAKKLGFNFSMSNSQVYSLMSYVASRNTSTQNSNATALFGNGQTTRNIASTNLAGWSKFRTDYVDYAHPIEAIQNAVKMIGGTILANQDAHAAITDATNSNAAVANRFDKQMIQPFLKRCKANNVDMQRFDEFLVARHAIERNEFHSAHITDASGMSSADAMKIIRAAEADGLVKVAQNQNGRYSYGGLYGSLGDDVQDMAKLRLDILYHGHMITKSQRDAITKAYEYYVPMTEVEDLPSTTPGIGGNSVKVSTEQLGRVSGRDTISSLGLAQMVHRVRSAIAAVEMNKVAQHFDRLMAANPNGNIVTRLPAGTKIASQAAHRDKLLSVRYNGVERLLFIHNPVIAQALRGGNPIASNKILNSVRAFSSFCVKMNVVYNPPFMITNMGKDAAHAMLALASRDDVGGVKGSDVVKKMITSYPQAMRFAFSKHVTNSNYDPDVYVGNRQMKLSELYAEFETSGAKPGYVFMGSMANSAREFQKECDLVMNKGAGASMKRFMAAGGDFISSLSEASEASTRFASYFAMRSLGVDSVTAGREAKELTINFARRGDKSSVLNALYLFANASIQGTNMLAKLAYRDGKINKRFVATMAGVAAFRALAVAACRACGDDDEGVPHYDKLEEYKRSQNLVLPGVNGIFPMIPLPYGFGLADSIGRVFADLSTKEQFGGGKYGTLDAGADLAEAVLQHFNPIGGDTTLDKRGLVHVLTPQIAKLAVELSDNSNFYGAPIRPEDREGLAPHLNHKKSTSAPARAAANALATAGFETSPDNLDHVASSLAGGAGKFVMQIIAMMSTGSDTSLNDIPVVRRYLGTAPDYVDTRSFKQNVGDIQAVRKEYDRIRLDPAMAADVKGFEGDHRAELRAAAALPGYEERLHKLYAARKKTTNAAQITEYNSRIRRLHREFNAYYYSQFKK